MKQSRIFKESVKEAFDNLPNGISFFNSKGLMVLCNHTMHRLAFSLTGRDLQSLPELQEALENLPENGTAVRDGSLFLLPDGTAWQFSAAEVTDRFGNVYTQVVAADITKLYQNRLALEESNKMLAEYGKRIRNLSASINIVTREEEILNTKMKVHDDIGRSIITARQFLLSKRPTDEFDITVWKKALLLLNNDSKSIKEKSPLEQLTEVAAGIGITIRADGALPENPDAAYLMIIAMRECAANAVRHAGATELYAKIDCTADLNSITITNNGAAPLIEISEGGGLTSLRTRIEKAGGAMTVKSRPVFKLAVSIPAEKEED